MLAGRPTDYTGALAEEICLRIAEGESLVAICREEAMPGRATVFRWLQKYEAFRNEYARAKELMVECLARDDQPIGEPPPRPRALVGSPRADRSDGVGAPRRRIGIAVAGGQASPARSSARMVH